jgi:hypothetical protein
MEYVKLLEHMLVLWNYCSESPKILYTHVWKWNLFKLSQGGAGAGDSDGVSLVRVNCNISYEISQWYNKYILIKMENYVYFTSFKNTYVKTVSHSLQVWLWPVRLRFPLSSMRSDTGKGITTCTAVDNAFMWSNTAPFFFQSRKEIMFAKINSSKWKD